MLEPVHGGPPSKVDCLTAQGVRTVLVSTSPLWDRQIDRDGTGRWDRQMRSLCRGTGNDWKLYPGLVQSDLVWWNQVWSADQTRPDQTRPDQTRADQTRPDQTTSDHTRPHQTRPDQTRPDQFWSGLVWCGLVWSDVVRFAAADQLSCDLSREAMASWPAPVWGLRSSLSVVLVGRAC
eukprot:364423-Chlamydomonas_euryale.AAC.6